MSVQRFVAATTRDAMNLVRAALGEDALILSNRETAEGVEILALAEEVQHDLRAGLSPPPPPSPRNVPAAAPPRPSVALDETAPISPRQAVAAYASQAPSALRSAPASASAFAPALAAASAVAAPSGMPAAPVTNAADFAALSTRLLEEMQQMRQLFDRQQEVRPQPSGWRAPLVQHLMGAGFSPALSQELLAAVPDALAPEGQSVRDRIDWLTHQLAGHLPVLADEGQLLDGGGVIALVGPTGVGKTTTTAKLAARYVMRHGASQVALVTTDSFRIGAHEQLRIYARLLGVEVHALAPDVPLDGLLRDLSSKRLVIIDTVGMSQRDQRLLTQINQLGAAGRPLRLMLVLNAASHGDTLDEVVDTYRRAALAAGSPLNDCIVSKCDEAARLGSVLDVLVRHNLRLSYISVGQQVPEDLHLADANQLLNRALDVTQPSLFAAPLSVPQGPGQRLDSLSRGLLGQGRALAALDAVLHREIDGFSLLQQAWSLSDLPHSTQGPRLAELLAATPVAPCVAGRQLLWGASRSAGSSWPMPVLTLDGEGRLQARPWLAHQLPLGAEPRLSWSAEQLHAVRHLLPAAPDAASQQWLQEQAQPWLAQAKGANRVLYAGERYKLQQLAEVAEAYDSRILRHRGRSVRLALHQLPVDLTGRDGRPAHAWFGLLRDADSDQLLGRRYWLASAATAGASALAKQAEALSLQLANDDLAALTLRAWNILGERQARLQAELRLYLAASLAASASRLDHSREPWALEARVQLQELIAKRRGRGPLAQLDGLLHLLTASDALRRLAHDDGRSRA